MAWQTEDGEMKGYLALPAGGQGAGVLLLHPWWGLTEFITGLCDQLAAAGFVALAPDLFGGQTAQTVAEAEQLLAAVDSDGVAAALQEALAFFDGHTAVTSDKIAIVGFSFGAAWALLAATVFKPTAVAATVIFYGNYPGLSLERYSQSQSAFLGHFAEDDPYEDADEVRATLADMQAAGREATFYFYAGTGHWFFEGNKPDAYEPQAAELAWQRTLAFLRQKV